MRLRDSDSKPLKRYDGEQIVLLDEDFNIVGLNNPHKSKAKWAQLQVRSVQHTGTHFLDDLLSRAGWKVRATHYTKENVKDRQFIISPIRNPKDVYITWQSRDRTEDFFESWQLFNEMYLNNADLYIVPVDTPNREDYLQKLCSKLQCQLVTNWAPVDSQPHKEVQAIDLTEIYNLPVVKKFY